ncbi:MAG: LysR family transcriptional regulator [Anaerolineae bacterium]|nr:LysR family transcriptional regulator [Anaerolineae bacterium]
MIDLYKLQIFDVVARIGSFSAAADRLYITQSAVSQHIKELETSLGQQLFVRGRRGVTPTTQGTVLADYSRQIFDLLVRAEAAVTNVEQIASGKVSIGATPGVGIYLAPDWVQQFRTRYPQLTVLLQTGVTDQIILDVQAHRLDLGVVEGELRDAQAGKIAHLVLEEVEQVVIMGFQHPFWDKPFLTLGDLNQQSFIVRQQGSQSRTWLDETLRAHGIMPIIGAEFDNLESMKRAVASGRCLALVPPYVVESEVKQNQLRVRTIEGKPLHRSLKLIWDRSLPFSPIALAFLTELARRYSAIRELIDSGSAHP